MMQFYRGGNHQVGLKHNQKIFRTICHDSNPCCSAQSPSQGWLDVTDITVSSISLSLDSSSSIVSYSTSFSSACAHLYSHISKPLLDVITISTSLVQLSAEQQANTLAGPLLGGVVILLTGGILRLVSPKFGVLVAEEAARKGYLRYTHSRLIDYDF